MNIASNNNRGSLHDKQKVNRVVWILSIIALKKLKRLQFESFQKLTQFKAQKVNHFIFAIDSIKSRVLHNAVLKIQQSSIGLQSQREKSIRSSRASYPLQVIRRVLNVARLKYLDMTMREFLSVKRKSQAIQQKLEDSLKIYKIMVQSRKQESFDIIKIFHIKIERRNITFKSVLSRLTKIQQSLINTSFFHLIQFSHSSECLSLKQQKKEISSLRESRKTEQKHEFGSLLSQTQEDIFKIRRQTKQLLLNKKQFHKYRQKDQQKMQKYYEDTKKVQGMQSEFNYKESVVHGREQLRQFSSFQKIRQICDYFWFEQQLNSDLRGNKPSQSQYSSKQLMARFDCQASLTQFLRSRQFYAQENVELRNVLFKYERKTKSVPASNEYLKAFNENEKYRQAIACFFEFYMFREAKQSRLAETKQQLKQLCASTAK